VSAGDQRVGHGTYVRLVQPIRVLITGGRDFRDIELIRSEFLALPIGSTIVHGAASGADAIAHSIALSLGHHPEPHWPDYANIPAALAPKVRNQQMVNLGADLCLAFPTARSRGTWHCVHLAEDAGIEVRVLGDDASRPTLK